MDETRKKYNWRQSNPHDQLTAIIGSLEGHHSNWCNSVISDGWYARTVDDHLQQLKDLQPYLSNDTPWHI